MQDPKSVRRVLPVDEQTGSTSVAGDQRQRAATKPNAAPERLAEVIDRLTEINRRRRDPELEVSLVDLRAEAARFMEPRPLRGAWPPDYPDPFPGVSGTLPEVHSSDLSPETLGGAVAHHGALLVRDIFDPSQVAEAVEAIERAHQMRARAQRGEAGDLSDVSWYRPMRTPNPMQTALERKMVGDQGGTWLGDSPTATAHVMHQLTESGVIDAITGHLGERPYFSLQKSTLRRSLPEERVVGWHQDGSFLGPEVRTMNVWVALSPCGGDLPTPGLEVVPRRIEEILPLGSDLTRHSIPFEVVDEVMAETPSIVPEFGPGDGLMFDQKFLHRTHLPKGMTEIRYALECWFFSPSFQAPEYFPLLA